MAIKNTAAPPYILNLINYGLILKEYYKYELPSIKNIGHTTTQRPYPSVAAHTFNKKT
jgi:hypothetical protein